MGQWHCTVNGTKYGPIELEVLRQWISEGRLRPADLVWREGMAAWQPAAGVPELGGVAPAPGLAPGYPQPHYPTVLPNAPGAVAGLVCGIIGTALGCMCLGTIVSVVLGIVAIQQSRQARDLIAANPLSQGGRGMATAGLILGIIGLCLGVLDIIYFLIVIAVAVAAH